MKTRFLFVSLFFAAFWTCGCTVSLGSENPKSTLYVLGDQIDFSGDYGHKIPVSIQVEETGSPPLVDSRKILFSRIHSTRGEYQFASWAEPPPARFTSLLEQALIKSTLFKSVSRNENGADANIILRTRMQELYHDLTTNPPVVRVVISATIMDGHSKNEIGRNIFEKNLQVTQNNVEGALHGFDQAIDEIIKEIIRWLALANTKVVK